MNLNRNRIAVLVQWLIQRVDSSCYQCIMAGSGYATQYTQGSTSSMYAPQYPYGSSQPIYSTQYAHGSTSSVKGALAKHRTKLAIGLGAAAFGALAASSKKQKRRPEKRR